VVVGKLASLSSKLLLKTKRGGRKYQSTQGRETTRQCNKKWRGKGGGGFRRYLRCNGSQATR